MMLLAGLTAAQQLLSVPLSGPHEKKKGNDRKTATDREKLKVMQPHCGVFCHVRTVGL